MSAAELVENRFMLLHLAGAGGMSQVYRALDQATGQPVAVKVLADRHGDDAIRLARESRILAELDHPQIVQYIAHGVLPSGQPYLVMEWLDGEDLGKRLHRGRLGVHQSIALGVRVAEALGFAHVRGVVHRDLKPSNIFLAGGQLDAIKLLDFGIAQMGIATRMTRTGALVGTPGYMAPEQARGGARVDARADVFSLGCVLFECLVGEPAFAGPHLMAVMARILFDEPRVRERWPEVPEVLEALLVRMLAKDPDERPRNGREVAEALRALGDLSSALASERPRDRLRPTSLTSSERRAVAVILIGAPEIEGEGEPPDGDALHYEAAVHGGHFERLRDGSVAVMLSRATLARDLASHAARCALSMRVHAPGRAIAVATNSSATAGHLPMGQAIDRAARLIEGSLRGRAAAQGTMPVILDEVSAGLLDARFDVRETRDGFVLDREHELAEGTRTLLGKPTPCVGRDRELAQLGQFFAECIEDSTAAAVLVTAAAGAGKSRLAQEFVRQVKERHESVTIWMGRGDPLRAGSAFGLLGQALRRACGIRDGEPLDVRREKLLARVRERVEAGERKRVAEFLGEMIGTPFPDEDSAPLRAARKDAQLMNDQMRAAFLGLLAAECKLHPVLVLLEDLHWGDRPTVQFLARALRDLRDSPLLVLALARPEVREVFPDLWSERRMQQFQLSELNRRAIERLARHVLGESVGSDTLDRLVRLSEGNAFYLEELIRSAAEGRGADLPETVLAMVQSRLGALDDDARRLLRAASVFGEVFWAGGVASLLGTVASDPIVKQRLSELIESELLVKRPDSRFPGEVEIAFRHGLLREGAYAMLTDDDRTLGHGLAGEWLEQRGEQDMLVLAEHFELGGEGEHAGQCYFRAAEQAMWGGDAVTALAHGRRGLACPVPEGARTKLLGTLCEAAFWHLESLSAVLPDAQQLVQIAKRGSLPWVQGMFAKLNGAIQAGRFDEFMATLATLQAIDVTPDNAERLALFFTSSTFLLDIAGLIQQAGALQERVAKIASTAREPLTVIHWHSVSGLRNGYARNDPWNAFGHGNTMLVVARANGHMRYIGAAQLFIGMNLWFLGASAEAERTLKKIALPDDEIAYASSVRPFCLAWLLADRADFDEAHMWASRLVESGKAKHLPLVEAPGRWGLAEVLRRAGKLQDAEEEIEAAIAILRAVSPLDLPGALATLAALRLTQGRGEEALAAAQEGMDKAESMGACSSFFRGAFLRVTHAECLKATDNYAAARAAIAKAREFILGVADKIGDATYQKSFLENVPENRKILDLHWGTEA